MRKDVTRSLLLWPSIASAMIAGTWWLSSTNAPIWQLIRRQAKIAWHHAGGPDFVASVMSAQMAFDEPMLTDSLSDSAAPKVLHSEVPAPTDIIPLVERADQGEAAMRIPERLAEDAGTDILYAPRIDEARETAGLALHSAGNVVDDVLDYCEDLLSYGLIAADTIASDGNLNGDEDFDMTSPHGVSATSTEPGDLSESRTTQPRSTSDAPMIVLLEVIDDNSDDDNSDFGQPILQSPGQLTESAAGNNRTGAVAVGPVDVEPGESGAEKFERVDPEGTVPAGKPRRSVMPSSIANLGDLAARPDAGTDHPPAMAKIVANNTKKVARRNIELNPAGWPLTLKLNEELEILASLALRESRPRENNQLVSTSSPASLASQWADQVADRLAQMRSLDRLGNPRAGVLIDELDQLATDGFSQAEALTVRFQQIQWLRTAYALARRVAVWRPVFQIVHSATKTIELSGQIHSSDTIGQKIERVRSELPETGDADGWKRFLLLDEIDDATSIDVDNRNLVAKRFLSRLQWHGLHPAHQQWLDRPSIHQLTDALRPWVSEAVDFAALLTQLERKETEPTMLAEREIADIFQTLRFSETAEAVALADAINTYYRNANVRIAISNAMLNRFLPAIEPQTLHVRTQILGSRVRGVSRVESDLDIQLQPADDRWSLKLQTKGNVRTQSVGRNGPAAFSTSRQSRFMSETPIELTKRDVQIGVSNIDVDGNTRLRGIRTNYDGWPLLGSLVRSLAQSKYYESSGTSNRIADRKMKTQLADNISQELNERLDARSNQLEQVILGPLGQLRLDPLVVDLQTTEERLLARYRLAGDWQLGAFTPRPRAPRTSLMSLQIHQSTINNALEQLVPREQPKPINQMIVDSVVMFGQPTPQLPGDIPEDVEVQFAKTRPITVEIANGIFRVTMRVIRLSRKEQMMLSRFIVRAEYRPEIDGLNAYLVRHGHLRISGPGMSMRERLPARAIFNKVLSPTRKLPLTLPALVNHPNAKDLAISQLELRDGWIGLAISEQDAPRIALQPKSD